ncbi:MAG: preprotein translocase subunit YajC [Chthoniobacteraceae bacterium]
MIYEQLLTLADAATPPSQGLGGLIPPMICIFVILYFMMIRPQNQKAKQQAALIDSVKTGDKVVVAGGIHGLVANVKETTVIVKVADNVKLEVEKSAVLSVTKRSENEASAAV